MVRRDAPYVHFVILHFSLRERRRGGEEQERSVFATKEWDLGDTHGASSGGRRGLGFWVGRSRSTHSLLAQCLPHLSFAKANHRADVLLFFPLLADHPLI